MGRPAKIWWRESRGQWFATIAREQVPLGPDRDAAQREFHRRKSEPDKPRERTLRTWVLLEKYQDATAGKIKPPTHRQHKRILNDWSKLHGSVPAVDLRPYHLSQWLTKHKTWGQSTRSLHAAIVKGWSAWCEREGYLDVDKLKSFKLEGVRIRKSVPPGLIEATIAKITVPEFRDFTIILFDTACRPSEIRGLEAKRIQWLAKTADVIGKRGQRQIGLTVRSLEILRRYAKRYLDGPVLRNEHGSPWAISTIKRHLDITTDRKKTGVILTPYHFRHDFYRRASLAGIPDVLIAKQLGHCSLHQLIARYAHPESSQLVSAVEATCTFAESKTRRRHG